jgi:hypothetical protein
MGGSRSSVLLCVLCGEGIGLHSTLKEAAMPIRYKSEATFLEMPVIAIAAGPDPANNEVRGHARGVIALGDIATGVLALGGVARGVVALGGVAIGGLALGGLGIGLLSFGGLALGYFAGGGAAIGYAAAGGLAIGYYATGGAAIGKYVVGPLHRDPEAVEFFSRLLRGIAGKLGT